MRTTLKSFVSVLLVTVIVVSGCTQTPQVHRDSGEVAGQVESLKEELQAKEAEVANLREQLNESEETIAQLTQHVDDLEAQAAGIEQTPTLQEPPRPSERHTYTLVTNVTPPGAGTVSPSDGEYEESVRVTLIATPAGGFVFDHWEGHASGSLLVNAITMDSDKTITAHFATADVAPPIVSDIEVSGITESTASIAWLTDERATGQVEYGSTDAYGSTTPLNEEMTTSHSANLSGLESNTTYHFRVQSSDASANLEVSSDHTFVTSPPARPVSGLISADTSWSSDYVYVVTGNIGIEQGVTLTIAPGTVVRFNTGCGLQVAGALIAEGIPSDPIHFTSLSSDPAYGDRWDGITFMQDSMSTSVVSHSVVECARDGLNLYYVSPSLHHNIIRHVSRYGIHFLNTLSDITVSYNSISNCSLGMYLQTHAEVTILYNTIIDNDTGVNVCAVPYSGHVSVVSNNLHSNRTYDLYVLGGQGHADYDLDATNNWWGTTDEALIEQHIFHYVDDLNALRVIFKPYATSSFPY